MSGLWIEADTGKRYPVSWFGLSDTKWLLEILTDAPFLPVCSRVFGFDLQPLEKIETDWLNFNLGSAIWQQPQTVIDCAQALAAAINTMPDVFTTLETERQRQGLDFLNLSGFDDEEMTSGLIQAEIEGIAETVKLAQREGAQRIKLTGS